MASTKYLEDAPEYFIVGNGQIIFPSGAAAMPAIPQITPKDQRMGFDWGDDFRVDPLTPSLAVAVFSYQEMKIDFCGPSSGRDGVVHRFC
jgi:hypothetical protein